MSKREQTRTMTLDRSPRPALKEVGGSDYDAWNTQISSDLGAAVPFGAEAGEKGDRAAMAAVMGLVSGKPADPVEAMIHAQMIAANGAALEAYKRAWLSNQTYEARMKYLALADKASRTVAVLAEALARHRGRGQQTVVVKHVTVHAEQAVVADQIVTGGRGADGKQDQPHAPSLGHAELAPLHGAFEEDGAIVPRSGGERL